MDCEIYKGVELPSEKLVFKNIVGCRQASNSDVDKIREFLLLCVDRFLDAFKACYNEEYKEDQKLLLMITWFYTAIMVLC